MTTVGARIPSIADCFRLMDVYRMLPNIRDHSVVVARIAALLVKDLASSDIPLSLDVVIAGALLHDIGKSACLDTPENHALKGRQICLAEQLDSIADIVEEHVILKKYAPEMALDEKVIVYYADKRVNHDQVVSLEERLAYILSRYAGNNAKLQTRIRENFNRCLVIEQRIFSQLAFKPSELAERIAGFEILPAEA